MEKKKTESPEEMEKRIKKTIQNQNKQLRSIFVVTIIIIGIFVGGYFVLESRKTFEYEGVDFRIVDEVAPYRTSIPLYNQDPVTGNVVTYEYNFYLRKDPRVIGEEVDFVGEFYLLENVVLNSSEDFDCDGDGIIAIANLANLLNKVGAEVIKDENATCDEDARYNHIQLKSGNQTKIIETNKACYEFIIKDCQILEVTERFMFEVFEEISIQLSNSRS